MHVLNKRLSLFSCVGILLSLFLGTFLLLTVSANGQTVKGVSSKPTNGDLEPISQFVNNKTLLVARIDFENVDSNRLGETLESLFTQIVVQLGIPQDSISTTEQEFHKAIEALKTDGKLSFSSVKNKLGFTQIYYVLQTSKGEGACFIIPAQSMSQEQVETIKTRAESLGLNCAPYQKKFVVASQLPLKEVGAFYKNFKSSENTKLNDYFQKQSDKFVSFYTNRFKIRPLFAQTNKSEDDSSEAEGNSNAVSNEGKEGIANTTPPKETSSTSSKRSVKSPGLKQNASMRNIGQEKIAEAEEAQADFLTGGMFGKKRRNRKVEDPFESAPRCVKDAVEIFDSSFVEGNGYIDVNTLTASASFKFSTSVNAGKFRQELGKVYEVSFQEAFNSIQQLLDTENNYSFETFSVKLGNGTLSLEVLKKYRVFPLLRELFIGESRSFLPEQKDAVLVFNKNASSELNKIGPNTIFVIGETFLQASSSMKETQANSPSDAEDMDSVFEETQDRVNDSQAPTSETESNPFLTDEEKADSNPSNTDEEKTDSNPFLTDEEKADSNPSNSDEEKADSNPFLSDEEKAGLPPEKK